MPRRRALVATLLLLSCYPMIAFAGSVCGTVSDASTSAPVPRAGVFLYQLDAYTGLHTATAIDGTYCVNDVPAGTYDLEVRVDDFQTYWVAGIEVTTSPTAVDVSLRPGPWLAVPWPNPASSSVSFEFGAPGSASMELRVVDARGRLVQGWSGPLDSNGRILHWDFRDHSGRTVAAGVYLVQLRVGDVVATRSFVRIR